MSLINCIRKHRDTRKCSTRELVCLSYGWVDEESKRNAKTYTSREVAELLSEILGNIAEDGTDNKEEL